MDKKAKIYENVYCHVNNKIATIAASGVDIDEAASNIVQVKKETPDWLYVRTEKSNDQPLSPEELKYLMEKVENMMIGKKE